MPVSGSTSTSAMWQPFGNECASSMPRCVSRLSAMVPAEHGAVPLSGGLRSQQDCHRAVAGKADRRGLVWLAAGVLEKAGDAKPAELSSSLRARAARSEALGAGEAQGLVEQPGEIPA